MPNKKVKFVTKQEIRRLFNTSILPKKKKGKFYEKVKKDNHPSRPLAKEPFCTKSQFVVYYDKNHQEVANAHRYLRRDGSLGASGKPDPKQVILKGIIYKVKG